MTEQESSASDHVTQAHAIKNLVQQSTDAAGAWFLFHMCVYTALVLDRSGKVAADNREGRRYREKIVSVFEACLLYTSDAADDM
eukprot:7063689-Prorocentrum_lima.AAC.1